MSGITPGLTPPLLTQTSFPSNTSPQVTRANQGTENAQDPEFLANTRAQAEQFEASFLASLLQPVFEGLAKDATFGGGFAEETFAGLLTQEYARELAGSSNLGIAETVFRQLIDVQENAEDAGSAPPQTSSSSLAEVEN